MTFESTVDAIKAFATAHDLGLPKDNSAYGDVFHPVSLRASRWKEFPALLASLGFTSGAEIGVETGRYSETLCRAIPGLHLRCVDAWIAYRGYRDHVTQLKLNDFYRQTVERMEPYSAEILRGLSTEVAPGVKDQSLDFVYIDGNHTLPYVIADIAAWAPKVKPGGIVAGHDFGRRSVGHVKDAVEAWVRAYSIAPWYLLTADKSPTWMWVAR